MLLEHNIEVYKKFEAMLAKNNKAILVTATGTGKSYIVLEYLERHDYRALVICPKRVICNEWEELTDRVDTMTYQKLCMTKDLAAISGYDCYVFDEAHHTGATVWEKATRAFMASHNEPMIGLTADSRRFSDGGRDVAEDIWGGHVVYGYDQAAAIDAGILPPATYVCAMFGLSALTDHYRRLNVSDKLMARLDYTIQNCDKIEDIILRHMPDGKRKGILFSDGILSTSDTKDLIQKIYPTAAVSVIHSGLPDAEVKETIAKFKSMDEGFLVAVDMLNEGIHIDGINTVIMLRRTGSPGVFMQQIGRGLSVGGKDIVIFDLVGNSNALGITLANTAAALERTLISYAEPKKSKKVIIYDYTRDLLSVMKDIHRELMGYWSEEEDDIIKKYFPTEGGKIIARLPGRTKPACFVRAKLLGVSYANRPIPWSEEEDEILKKYYPTECGAVSKRLPDRSRAACFARTHMLGIYQPNRTMGVWTKEEDDILRAYYKAEGGSVSARLPGHTKNACKVRARAIGVTQKTPQPDWTEEEDNILKEFYYSEGTKVADRLPGRTRDGCRARARKLGCGKSAYFWTNEEVEILRKCYPLEGRFCAARLPGKSKNACKDKAIKLGICSNKAIPKS